MSTAESGIPGAGPTGSVVDEAEQARAALASLVAKRGDERVTFADVADHLGDHMVEHPEDEAAVERLARFLARVEDRRHGHDDPDVGSSAVQE